MNFHGHKILMKLKTFLLLMTTSEMFNYTPHDINDNYTLQISIDRQLQFL